MASNPLEFEQPIAELDDLIAELKRVASDPEARNNAAAQGTDVDAEIARVEERRREMLQQIFEQLTPWDEVQMARHRDRPYSLDYIRLLFTDFVELRGDRTNADDQAIVGGLARFRGAPVVVIGHQKGRDLRERQLRNFGSARPAGFRKALRLMQLAEKFRRPIITLVDTPAAEANLMAEEEGISTTIAVSLREMSTLQTPIVVAVIGEGGSGGALGIALGDRVLMLQHAVYSVIPPEGCAAILWNDRGRAAEAAAALHLTAADAMAYGLVDEVIPEPLGGAHRDPQGAADTLGEALERRLKELFAVQPSDLPAMRYAKFRAMGRWTESEIDPPA
ncbi:MAG: acetyl-CoA carboxylase carboxyltransferase subunit alpha [Armatimonadetes bacterium]|nr:acetyl-CoA carboxylase carboxyltransferase subunit alpha [Armatimonadota bacterium]MDE2205897.1 acetyl-CoA carboxylase carboxyltransferase subunit alpha [Armatimonadota bacterium]